jgi:hypothetical protein
MLKEVEMRLLSVLAVLGALGRAREARQDKEMEFLDEILSEELHKADDPVKTLETSAKRDHREFDHNKDGEIDALEVVAQFSSRINAIDLFYFFSNADKDASGTVSFPEYLDYVRSTSSQAKGSTSQ